MSNRTKLTIFIGAVAAVVSALVLIVVFWDKLLSLCPCRKSDYDDELSDYADLNEGCGSGASPGTARARRGDFLSVLKE